MLWTEAEPSRLERDRADVLALVAEAVFEAPQVTPAGSVLHHGRWTGQLPAWPFDRPAPPGLHLLIAQGLVFDLRYSSAYPMLPPTVYPESPSPAFEAHSQHRWHVAPGGGLCLLQHDGLWDPAAKISDLLLKAAGWRIEYELMVAGRIDTMTLGGIVDDPCLDERIAEVAGEHVTAGSVT